MWVVELRQGDTWMPVCYCVNRTQADLVAVRPHIRVAGETRVREYGKSH